MKVDCKIFKGIEYVEVSELPQDQREELNKSINTDLFIKLLIDGRIVSGCLQYKDYQIWYSEFSQSRLSAAREQIVVQGLEIKPNLALNKI